MGHDVFPLINFIVLMIVIWSIWRERKLRMPYERLFDEVAELRVKLAQCKQDE